MVECLYNDEVACGDEDVMACLDKGVLECFYNDDKDDFDVDYIHAQPL